MTSKVQQIREAMASLVSGKEDFLYQQVPLVDYETGEDTGDTTCVYVHDGKPSCLIGQLMFALDVPLEQMARHEGTSAREVVPLTLDLSRSNDEPLIEALTKAQEAQDDGHTWGEAYKAFDNYLKGYGL